MEKIYLPQYDQETENQRQVELYFLGTGAGMPSRHRNVTSLALNLLAERGEFWLFDCGEGTQQQILRSPVKLSRTEKLFISHMHGDHIYGIPGLLTSRSYLGGETPVTLYGPKGIRSYVDSVLQLSQAHLTYELRVVEIETEGILFDDESFQVEVARLEHRVESFGFRIVEKDQPGKLQQERLQAMGIPPGPLYGRLKQGKTVRLDDGTELNGHDFVGERVAGRKVVILGDTKYCRGALHLARGADVLVHEATFDMSRQELANAYDHATSIDAARTAREAGAKVLIMTHISSRFQEEGAQLLVQEARSIHAESYLAQDFWSYAVERG